MPREAGFRTIRSPKLCPAGDAGAVRMMQAVKPEGWRWSCAWPALIGAALIGAALITAALASGCAGGAWLDPYPPLITPKGLGQTSLSRVCRDLLER